MEKKKRSLKGGLGYGDEEKIRARLGLRYRNLWGGGRLLDLDARYSTLGFLASELFTNPAVFGSSFDFVQQSGARQRNLPGFNDRAFFTQSRLERDIPWDLRVYFGHGLEFDRPFNLPVETLIRLEGTQPEKLYRASYALIGLRQDTSDSHIEPRRGGILDLANEFAPTFLGSGIQFLQSVLDLRRYQAIGDSKFVAAGRSGSALSNPSSPPPRSPYPGSSSAAGPTASGAINWTTWVPATPATTPSAAKQSWNSASKGAFLSPFTKKSAGWSSWMRAMSSPRFTTSTWAS